MRTMAIATMAAALGMSVIGDDLRALSMIEPTPSAGTKRSAGDKAHRAFTKTRLYSPNGARECARRARQAAALQSKATA